MVKAVTAARNNVRREKLPCGLLEASEPKGSSFGMNKGYMTCLCPVGAARDQTMLPVCDVDTFIHALNLAPVALGQKGGW